MNKKVLIVMIGLVISFLVTDYILKIFFPENFAMVITIEKFIKIGEFIDSHDWLCRLCDIITSFITYWLYICAVTRKWSLDIKGFLLVCLAIGLNHIVYDYDINLAINISVVAMIGIPAILNAKLKDVATVYCIHYTSQTLSITIRNFPQYLTNISYMPRLYMVLECYFWLLLFYLLYNYKEEKKWEELVHHSME